jgi:UDP-2,3-diacylglucosamine pyrophosphatase LpxH
LKIIAFDVYYNVRKRVCQETNLTFTIFFLLINNIIIIYSIERSEKSLITINPDINQMQGENPTEWKIRLMIGKAQGFYENYTWKQIAELVDPEVKCESHFSDKAKGMLMFANYLNQDENLDFKSLRQINILQKNKLESEKRKIQARDEKNIVRRMTREYARWDSIAQEINNSLKNWSKCNKIKVNPQYQQVSNNEAILLLSDWHYGQTTSNNVNTFNEQVADERIKELITQTIEHIKLFKVRKLHVFILGDIVNGLIHVTSRINAAKNIYEQTTEATKKLMDLIVTLRDYVPQVNVYGVRGNHDRMIANFKEHVVEESFFDIMYYFLKGMMDGMDGIKFITNDNDSEIITANICNKNIMAVHGDKDKPKKAVSNLTGMLQNFPDYIFMGHFHHQEEQESFATKVIVNGSFCGVDAFAQSKRLISKPSQNLIILNENDLFCKIDLVLKSGVNIDHTQNVFKKY